MSKLMFRLVPNVGAPFMAVFNVDERALDALQLAILRTPGLMSGEARGHIVDAILSTEVFQHENHVVDEPEPLELKQVGTITKEELEALGVKVEPFVPPKFTAEQIEKAAEAAHEANRAYCRDVLMDNSQVPWAEAPTWQRQSAIDGIYFAIKNDFPSPEAMHENWMRDKVANGWVYGPVKDPDAKTHPSLRPFAELPEAERGKDELFRKTIMESLGVKDQPVVLGTMKEFGPGEGPAILAGLGAEPIVIKKTGDAPHDEAKPTP